MRYLMWTALTAGLMLTASSVSQANDTFRLGGPSAQAAIEGGTDSELVHWRGGYYGGRGYYGGYGRGYYGGYGRGYYGGYYRPYYGFSFYRPYYRPYIYSYYPSYYSSSYYYDTYSSPYYYYTPINGTAATNPPAATLQQSTYVAPRANVPPMQPATNGDATFPYNGGPKQVVPMPPASDPAPINRPGSIIPLDGKLVSLPRETGGGVSSVSTPAVLGWNYLPAANISVQQTSTRIAYPAYGENSVVTPQKTPNR